MVGKCTRTKIGCADACAMGYGLAAGLSWGISSAWCVLQDGQELVWLSEWEERNAEEVWSSTAGASVAGVCLCVCIYWVKMLYLLR